MWEDGIRYGGRWLDFGGATVAAIFTYDFTQRGILCFNNYLEEKYGDQYSRYETAVPYKFVPYVW
ncbi:hypothetical protein BTJ68_14297 [Hortaea werneckii EXF-2000]|uniref:Uncharacterized protein n=1 Tax=Hortaea werneckii EXF-2000 TaxID=1157616 RepID=A0A1Z5SQD2_HORWE|nr:hypothetical protein BTJ68_14297 [Hortaea werneckii EXF-2000]